MADARANPHTAVSTTPEHVVDGSGNLHWPEVGSGEGPILAAKRAPAAPLFAATLLLCCGIMLQRFCYKPAGLCLLCLLGLMLCSLAALRFVRGAGRAVLAYMAAVLAFLPTGALLWAARQAQPSVDAPLLSYAGGEEVILTGYVARSGSLRAGRYNSLGETLDLAVEQAEYIAAVGKTASSAASVSPTTANGAPQLGTVRLSLYVPSSRSSAWETESEPNIEDAVPPPLFDYGQRLRVRAKLRPPANYRNPGSMDYVGWLQAQGVAVLGSAKSTSVEVLPRLGGSRLQRVRWRLRRRVLEQMSALWPQPYAGLLQAMVLGERGLVDREQRLEFQRSGTFHLLVVSGMNVAVFAVFLLWGAGRLRLRPELAVLGAILLTLGYAWLTDLGTPILRSVAMIIAYQIAALLNRDRAPLNTVALAALLLLVVDPSALFDASFQLTFLAVLTLAGLAAPVLDRSTGRVRQALEELDNVARDATLRPKQAQLRLDLRMIAASLSKVVGERVAQWMVPATCRLAVAAAELFVLSALMQIALVLPTIWYFHRFNAHALWANMAVLPLMGVLMPCAVLAVTLAPIAHWLAVPAALLARWSLQGILAAIHWSGGAQAFEHRVAMPAMAALLAFAGCYALALLVARRHRLLTAAALTLLTASAALAIAHTRPFVHDPRALEITAIDIGQGDSFLLVTPGGHTLLLDSGGLLGSSRSEFDMGEDVVSPYLWQRGLSTLDAAAFSHSHSDHIGGMAAVLRNFHPRELWYGPSYRSAAVGRLFDTADGLHVRRVQHHAGDEFDFDGVHVSVLSPPAGVELKPRGQDDASMVLRVSYAGHSALLLGDIHKRMEQALMEYAEERGEPLKADLLKVAHHGSNTSSCAELLDAVTPQFAVISAGIRNPFHHPRPEVIERLAEHHARTYRTDWFGPVTFYLDAQGVRATVMR